MASLSASAGCMYVAEVSTEALFMDISDGGCGEFSISFSNKIGKDGKPVHGSIKSFPFDKECVINYDKNGDLSGLSCHARGRTPLAGATYRLRRSGFEVDDCHGSDGRKIPIYQYVCIKGCTPPVPKILDVRNICD